MENASKAIIIGGSVLISILIVSLGIYIYNSTKDTTGTAAEAAETLEVQIYNQKFEKYIVYYPTKTRGSTIKKLISEAIAGKDDITITVKSVGTFGGNSEQHLSQALPLINDNQEWYCGSVIYDENGRITSITFGD